MRKPNSEPLANEISEILEHRPRTDGRERVRHLESSSVARKVIEVYEKVLRKQNRHAKAKRPPFADLLNVQRRRDAHEAREAIETTNES